MPEFFYQHAWASALLWAAFFVSDYVMTLRCARMYRNGVNEKFVFEGSFELTPLFQKDVDQLRKVSPRFVAILVIYSALMMFLWLLVPMGNREVYTFLVGGLVGPQFAVHIRHIRNYVMFRMAATDAVRGRMEYSRPMILKASAGEMAAMGGMFGLLGVLTVSWFPVGAAIGTMAAAWKHYRLANKAAVQAAAAAG